MKSHWLLIGLSALTLPFFVAADAPRRDLAKENADLRTYVNQLEDKVRALQEEVRELKRLKAAQPELRFTPVPPPGDLWAVPFGPRIEPRQDRRNWQEHRFNGGTYYIIPLAPADLTPPRRP